MSLQLTLPRLLRSLSHFRQRRNYTLSPTLLLTCSTKITLNIHHNQPIEACYTQLSCFYEELISLHLTLPRSLRFLLHFRRRRNYTLTPTLLLTCSTKITLNIHHNQPIEACYTQLSCIYEELISLHLTLPRSLRFLLHFRQRRNYTLSPTLLLTCTTKITLNIHHNQPIEACYTQLSCFYEELISLHLTLPRSLRFLLHFRQRRNYTLSPTLLLTCSTKIALNIHHNQPIEACYTQLSCFYKELISLHLTLPRLLRFLSHFRQRRNYTLSPTLLLTCSTKITLNIHHYQPIEACYTQLSCFYKELISLHLTLPRSLRFLSHFRQRRNYTLSPTLLLTCLTKITLNIHHYQSIEACYTQLSCFYKELMSLHLTLPRSLRFPLHFRQRRNYSLSPTLLLTCSTKITLNIHHYQTIEACYTQLSCFYKELMSLHLTLPRSLRFPLHFRQRCNYSLSPTLLLTCQTKITLNIHHYQPIEACYTQLSCFYKELMSLHLTLPRSLRFPLHFRQRCNYTLSPTLLLTCRTKITLNIHHYQPIEACYTQLSCFYKELMSLHLTLPLTLTLTLDFRYISDDAVTTAYLQHYC